MRWVEIKNHPVHGHIRLPGSKSETNRLAIIALLSDADVLIKNPATAEDSLVMFDFLHQSKKQITHTPENHWYITAGAAALAEIKRDIHVQAAGTALRFLTAAAAFLPGTTRLDGIARLRQRPIIPLLYCLEKAGVKIDYLNQPYQLPFVVNGDPHRIVSAFTIDGSESSQFVSALLLLAPVLAIGTEIELITDTVATAGYIDLTLQLLKRVGYHWQSTKKGYVLTEKNLNPTIIIDVEGDWTAAGYALAWAITGPATINLSPLFAASLQADSNFLQWFTANGIEAKWLENNQLQLVNWQQRTVNVIPDFDIDFTNNPDLAQTFAVLAAFSRQTCYLSGLQTLPYKETNRLMAICNELTRIGCQCSILDKHVLAITPTNNLQAPDYIRTYGDHRMAMSFSVLARLFDTIYIEDPGVVAKSWPDFWQALAGVGLTVSFKNTLRE